MITTEEIKHELGHFGMDEVDGGTVCAYATIKGMPAFFFPAEHVNRWRRCGWITGDGYYDVAVSTPDYVRQAIAEVMNDIEQSID